MDRSVEGTSAKGPHTEEPHQDQGDLCTGYWFPTKSRSAGAGPWRGERLGQLGSATSHGLEEVRTEVALDDLHCF